MPLRAAAFAMGTRFELVLDGLPERALRAAADAATSEIESLHRRLSAFARDSLVAHICRTAHITPVRLDAEMFGLFAEAEAVRVASGGAFDITIGRAMRRAGLHAGEDERPGSGLCSHEQPTAPAAPDRAAARIVLDESSRTIALGEPGIRLDLGAIAKGHALDIAAGVLREAGVPCALVHGGTSSAVAIGAPPGREGWMIAIGDGGGSAGGPAEAGGTPAPLTDGAFAGGTPAPLTENAPLIVATLRDAALSVSAPAGRAIEGASGEVITHILDPRTGEPARTAVRTAAVVSGSARTADAWSTALVVVGERPGSMPRDISTCILTPAGPDLCDPLGVFTPAPRAGGRSITNAEEVYSR